MVWDGDIALQALIPGAIDLALPAGADLLDNAVVAQRLADHGNAPVGRHLRPRPQASQREGPAPVWPSNSLPKNPLSNLASCNT